RGGLDEVAELDSVLFRIADEIRGDPVLHRTERVVPFELRVDLRMLERNDPVEAHHRCRVVLVGEHVENVIEDPQRKVSHGRTPGSYVRESNSSIAAEAPMTCTAKHWRASCVFRSMRTSPPYSLRKNAANSLCTFSRVSGVFGAVRRSAISRRSCPISNLTLP